MKRIGLFGGSFDPVHIAHVALAQSALAQIKLDQVRWIPAGLAYQKARPLTGAHHRAAMVELAIRAEPRFVLDASELQRAGPSYTLDTVRAAQSAAPEAQWFLIIGADQYASLHTWKDWPELLARVTLAVANRPGAAPAVNAAVLRAPHRVVPLPMMDISSTEVRKRVAAGQPIAALVPPQVARYIETHHLYRS